MKHYKLAQPLQIFSVNPVFFRVQKDKDMLASTLYTAMVEEEANTLAADRRRRQMNRPAPAPSPKDIQQDAHIRAIEHENQRIKGCFAALVHVLMEKGIVDDKDVREVIADVEKVAV